ncbi:hypothetical protein [Oryzihumus sp.]
MRVLVAKASRHGSTLAIAEAPAHTLREELPGAEVDVDVVRAPYGDFRDWPAVQEWGRRIAAALVPQQHAG